MKKYFLLLSLALPGALLFAQEPANLATAKQTVLQYHDSGEYAKDLVKVTHEAENYLTNRLAHPNYPHKKPAIVFDIDETALSNYDNIKALDFGGNAKTFSQNDMLANDPVIQPVYKLYQFANAHHVTVFFLTGRKEEERAATEKNLHHVGYQHWQRLILRDGKYKTVPAATYKTAMRKQLSKEGYEIMVNIGDQDSDLRGGYADSGFKLPNPYYYIP